jgi:serine/threonine protein kinase
MGTNLCVRVVIPEGFNGQRLQSLPCRAPEVWMNKGVYHALDIWSLGITVRRLTPYQ